MTLAKSVVTGIVYKTPKTGYTQNNVAVSSFVLNVGEGSEEILVRVISKRQALASVVDSSEKKVFEIEASTIELFSGAASASASSEGEILSFGEMESTNSSSSDNVDYLIDEEEVPF